MKKYLVLTIIVICGSRSFAFTCDDKLPTGKFTQEVGVDGSLRPTAGNGSIEESSAGGYVVKYKSPSGSQFEYKLTYTHDEVSGFGCVAKLVDKAGTVVPNLGLASATTKGFLAVGVSEFLGHEFVTLTSSSQSGCEGCRGGVLLDNFLRLSK